MPKGSLNSNDASRSLWGSGLWEAACGEAACGEAAIHALRRDFGGGMLARPFARHGANKRARDRDVGRDRTIQFPPFHSAI
jgi:hypothetical protein